MKTDLLFKSLIHEIKNPLNVISINMQFLEKKLMQDNFSKQELVETVKESKNQINRVVDILHYFTRYTSRIQLNFQLIDYNKIINKIIKFLTPQLFKKNIKVETNFAKLPEIYLDENLIKSIILNLLVNSIDAIEDKDGLIKIITSIEEGLLVTKIIDNGKGIKEYNLKKIFNEFFTTKETGTGLGLTIVKKIIKELEGNIFIKSAEGQGTEVEFYFDLKKLENMYKKHNEKKNNISK